MSTLMATLTGTLRYRGREGQLSFILHRLTGLGTLLFLSIHILDTATVYFAPGLYQHAIAIYRATPFMIGEIILVFAVLFHGANGLRIALFDLFPSLWQDRSQRNAFYTTLLISIGLWLPAAFVMGRNMILNNFGGG
jgi:succinate dehydrogenase / fumarate reductase cytochrome b subunit